jgi:type I restriction enzyme M protein
MMVISIPQNFLFKDSLKILRKYLTHEKNYIDAIINIPNEFGRYKRPEVIIVFKKNRTDDKILFIDMSRDFETKRARIMVPGIFKRNLLLSDSTISRMVDVLAKRSTVGKYSNLIAIDEITGNGFNLSVSKYVDTFEGRFIRLEDLVDEKREIDERLDGLNEKINMMMDELNIRF